MYKQVTLSSNHRQTFNVHLNRSTSTSKVNINIKHSNNQRATSYNSYKSGTKKSNNFFLFNNKLNTKLNDKHSQFSHINSYDEYLYIFENENINNSSNNNNNNNNNYNPTKSSSNDYPKKKYKPYQWHNNKSKSNQNDNKLYYLRLFVYNFIRYLITLLITLSIILYNKPIVSASLSPLPSSSLSSSSSSSSLPSSSSSYNYHHNQKDYNSNDYIHKWSSMSLLSQALSSSTSTSSLSCTDSQLSKHFNANYSESNCSIGPVIRIGYLTNLHGRKSITRQGIVISGAIKFAIEKINNNSSILKGAKLDFIYNDTNGEILQSTKAMLYQWSEGAIAFIGPEDSCEVEATIAAALNLPMISYKCANTKVSEKDFYSTFARTQPPGTHVTRSVLALFRNFNWRKFSIIYENSLQFVTIAKYLVQRAVQQGFTINSERSYENFYSCCEDNQTCCINPFPTIIDETYKTTRIYLFFGNESDLEKLLRAMHIKNLFKNGEYLLVYVDFDSLTQNHAFKYIWRSTSLLEAAQSLLVIVPSPPRGDDYSDFEDKVRQYNTKEPFNFPSPFEDMNLYRHITIFASYLYDAVMLYAEAIESMFNDGLCPRDGREVIRRIIGKKRYKSVTGAWMTIDENGDAEGNYTVLALNNVPTNISLNSFDNPIQLNYTMLPVGSFDYDVQTNETVFKSDNRTINWVAGRPPADEPPCRFDGSKCLRPEDNRREIIASILLGLFIAITIITAITYRNWKYEQEIAGLLWKIQARDLNPHFNDFSPLSASRMSIASANSTESRTLHQVYTRTALYRGTIVAVKELYFSRKSVDLPREIKKEMKLMKELHHDKINSFIGANIDPSCVLIVTEYCAKGSLQDVLDNKNLKLDGMFTASLVFDLISAMIYLHDSDIKVHGNLKSTNCLITSRWVLKVTDFGLHQLRKSADKTSIETDSFYRNLLYTSPELLRDPQVKGTQKGDVYAFSIILHEITVREGPFSLHVMKDKLNPQLIVDKVMEDSQLKGLEFCPFRPSTSSLQCQDYVINTMKDCWAEEPETRPDFRAIRTRLKRMRHGLKANIMDNMMVMMEKYANNLEDLVDERTEQLAEEKKKTESLLYRMLPKTVAAQLVRGECVIPETFDAVTIFFSDIVGFTGMSAESTPMEVVTFLNDLYTLFDTIISSYDVYKVETIGDAYMVVSGLPIRNDDQHASEIASMALELLDSVRSFKIRHRKDQTLQLRIGIHTGPVVAGVVGTTMPRYCLFGDTVNTASRMESNGEPLKIHISPQCRDYLVNLGSYIIKERGFVKLKGKGEVLTYWLIGHEGGIHHRRDPSELSECNQQPTLFAGINESSGKRRASPKITHTNMVRRGSSITFKGIDTMSSGHLSNRTAYQLAQYSQQQQQQQQHQQQFNSHSDSNPPSHKGSPKMPRGILKNVHNSDGKFSINVNIIKEEQSPGGNKNYRPILTHNPKSVPSHLSLLDEQDFSENSLHQLDDDGCISMDMIMINGKSHHKNNNNQTNKSSVEDQETSSLDDTLDYSMNERRGSRAALLRCSGREQADDQHDRDHYLDRNKNLKSKRRCLSCSDLVDTKKSEQDLQDSKEAKSYAKYLSRGASYLQFNYPKSGASIRQWLTNLVWNHGKTANGPVDTIVNDDNDDEDNHMNNSYNNVAQSDYVTKCDSKTNALNNLYCDKCNSNLILSNFCDHCDQSLNSVESSV